MPTLSDLPSHMLPAVSPFRFRFFTSITSEALQRTALPTRFFFIPYHLTRPIADTALAATVDIANLLDLLKWQRLLMAKEEASFSLYVVTNCVFARSAPSAGLATCG